MALLLLGISLRVIKADNAVHQKFKSIFLAVSAGLLALGILSKFFLSWPGGNLEVVIAVLGYCFLYAPLELYLKNARWSIYSSNKWEMFLLSSIDFVGINLILLGMLSIYMSWPGQYYLIYPGCGILLIGLISWNTKFKQEVINRKNSEDKIKQQYQEIEREKQQADNLLLNILPAEVAEELKAKGSADAKQFDEVTVLFTDFKDFTKLSEKMSAKELVEEINACFIAFDKMMENHGLEKIKTIGDSYMCAGGLPIANKTHAVDVVSAALEIQQYILNRMAERIAAGKEPFQVRIGIHTGPVVAGIVGIKKFAYDIWGDTVNTASRMESSGEVGKVNISGTTYQLVKDQFNCIHRGKIQAKGKGDIEMYFVEGKI
ncbi:MAG: adenylate/guanylate cyclase domain-containing protein [Bacteroidetes bacterium]|nr:adenylate/guanylate cyclase domain-containing protein [Bacteroidota bacterium]